MSYGVKGVFYNYDKYSSRKEENENDKDVSKCKKEMGSHTLHVTDGSYTVLW